MRKRITKYTDRSAPYKRHAPLPQPPPPPRGLLALLRQAPPHAYHPTNPAPPPHAYHPTTPSEYPLMSRDMWWLVYSKYCNVGVWRNGDLAVKPAIPKWCRKYNNTPALCAAFGIRALHPMLRRMMPIEHVLEDHLGYPDTSSKLRSYTDPFINDVYCRWLLAYMHGKQGAAYIDKTRVKELHKRVCPAQMSTIRTLLRYHCCDVYAVKCFFKRALVKRDMQLFTTVLHMQGTHPGRRLGVEKVSYNDGNLPFTWALWLARRLRDCDRGDNKDDINEKKQRKLAKITDAERLSMLRLAITSDITCDRVKVTDTSQSFAAVAYLNAAPGYSLGPYKGAELGYAARVWAIRTTGRDPVGKDEFGYRRYS